MTQLKPVDIEWVDSAAHGRPWCDVREANDIEPLTMITRGFLIRRTKSTVTFCHTQRKPSSEHSGGEYAGTFTIPRCCINKMRVGK